MDDRKRQKKKERWSSRLNVMNTFKKGVPFLVVPNVTFKMLDMWKKPSIKEKYDQKIYFIRVGGQLQF